MNIGLYLLIVGAGFLLMMLYQFVLTYSYRSESPEVTRAKAEWTKVRNKELNQ